MKKAEYNIVRAVKSNGEMPYCFLLPPSYIEGLGNGWTNGSYERLLMDRTYSKEQAENIMNKLNRCTVGEQDKLLMILDEFDGEFLSEKEKN